MVCNSNIMKHFNENNLKPEEVLKGLVDNNLEDGFIYKKIYYEFIDPYPYILQHPIPIIRLWYYFLYFLLFFGKFFTLLIVNPIRTIKNFFVKKTSVPGAENNIDVASLEPNLNKIVDFSKDKEKNEIIIKTESFYFSYQKSKIILKELLNYGFNIPFLNKLSDFFRIKLRVEYILNPLEEKKNEVTILYTFPKAAMDILNFENQIKNKIKNGIIFLKNRKKKGEIIS